MGFLGLDNSEDMDFLQNKSLETEISKAIFSKIGHKFIVLHDEYGKELALPAWRIFEIEIDRKSSNRGDGHLTKIKMFLGLPVWVKESPGEIASLLNALNV